MKNNKGFTLIELLVVVLIIGILAAIALPQYFKAVERSRAAEANSVIGAINHAQAVYRMANPTQYAGTFNLLDTEFVDNSGAIATGSSFTTDLFTYTLTGGATDVGQVRAVRGDSLGYTLGIQFGTGERCCTDGTGNGGAICASLGLAGQNC